MQALERRSLSLVRLLEDKYGPALARDAALGALLSRVEGLYLSTGGGGGGGLLGSLLRGMLEGDEGDD
jgi:hypothetical protein